MILSNPFAQAIVHKHSTLSEAILVGKKMKAKYTLLTHFPSLFQQVPQLSDLRDARYTLVV